jgi:hypothetical protein
MRTLDERPIGGADPSADDDLPKLTDLKAVYLGLLLVLALLAAGYVAAEIVLPIVVAWVLKLVLQPVMRLLRRCHLPNGIAGLLMIWCCSGPSPVLPRHSRHRRRAGLRSCLGIPKLEQRLRFVSRPIARLEEYVPKGRSFGAGRRAKGRPRPGERRGSVQPVAGGHNILLRRAIRNSAGAVFCS